MAWPFEKRFWRRGDKSRTLLELHQAKDVVVMQLSLKQKVKHQSLPYTQVDELLSDRYANFGPAD